MTIKSGKISFVSDLPQGCPYSFAPNLYNLPDHIALLDYGSIKSFYMIDHNHQIVGLINFIIEDNRAMSLPQRPFGSFEFCNSVSYDNVHKFVEWAMDQLKSMDIETVIIKHYSSLYGQDNFHKVLFALTSNGFQVTGSDINHHIQIIDCPFQKFIDRQEKKRLNKCKKEDFQFQKEPVLQLEEIYNFISICRKRKDQPVSIPIEQLSLSCKAFPDQYVLFSVRKEGKLAAASVSVIANGSILYDFMHANPEEYNVYSPVVLLVEGIYNFCQQNQFKYLDLGISSFENHPQISLIRFKENIGGIPTVKITFKKNWTSKSQRILDVNR
jgi:hypothetical protein